ncbi:hypothetical protein [Actinomadura litoris]|uniref:hypothetical protein n=1 Tax=Actinomadura litoris TaxID=2678616 RepID=UPI001FA6F576|nr:hypothetical protein [Actinomadura litoris]
MISAAMWGRLTVRQVDSYQQVKGHNPGAYREMVLRDEIGMRAYQQISPCPWEYPPAEDEDELDGSAL